MSDSPLVDAVNMFYEKLAVISVTLILAAGMSGGSTSSVTANNVSVESALKASLMSGTVPPDLEITYDDTHGLWGGTTILIHGSGDGERQERTRGDAMPKVFETALQQKQLLELIKLLIELKAWEQQTPDRPPVPDESRATLTIGVDGQRSSIWEWFNEMAENKRLIRIKAKMSKMIRSAK